ncbi:hypothetical protein Ctha_0600 [Chloroherpeton thalassium ATCC 35110]|uniref:Uncharacterized protein n=1 Tax=Chloroherpeton thalassium (strain ATCC 35110 / GB-78) TaxID=517418 RepID=B3QVB6_CHLT3|nr:hypothetical protein [Chloroherpeton thalassium]ACF13070.1 hypothetical protein Ctha_0600 [Chloroherpeton thalassium ATCC 35110]
MIRKSIFFISQIWAVALLVLLSANSATAEVTEPTVCFYYKHINPANPEEGFYFKVVNNNSASDLFQVLYSSRNKSYYLDFGQESTGGFSSRIVLQDFKEQIGRFFSTFSRGKLTSLTHYKTLIDYVTDGGRLLKEVDLSAYGIKDKVYAFNFDALAANAPRLKNMKSPESLALYNFTQNQWFSNEVGLDYKAQVLRADYSLLAKQETILQIFETELAIDAPKPIFSDTDRDIIRSADTKATWAILLAVVSVLVVAYLSITVTSSLRRRATQLSRIEAKVKHLEGKLNRPFYQVDQLDGSSSASQPKLQNLEARIDVLERNVRGSAPSGKA